MAVVSGLTSIETIQHKSSALPSGLDKLVEATDPVPKGWNNQEPGTEVPGKRNQRIESRKGRHRTKFVPIRLVLVRPLPPT